jgi:hypothetical protein
MGDGVFCGPSAWWVCALVERKVTYTKKLPKFGHQCVLTTVSPPGGMVNVSKFAPRGATFTLVLVGVGGR